MRRSLIGLVVIGIISVCWPTLTFAHGIVAGGARVIEVQAGAYPVRVEVSVPIGAPAMMTVKIWPQRAYVGVATIDVRAIQQNTSAEVVQTITIPANMQTISVADLMIPATGIWDIHIRIHDEKNGVGEVVVPITINPPVVPPLTIPLFISVACVAGVLVASIMWPTMSQRRRTVQGVLVTAALSVSVMLGVLMIWPNLRIDIPQTDTTSRPYVNATFQTLRDTTRNVDVLQIALSDGSTGLPADDLVPHHQALMHAILLAPQSNTFLHVHPARIAPGMYLVDLPAVPTDTYDVSIEFERINSGSQTVHHSMLLGTLPVPREQPIATLPATISVAGYVAEVKSKPVLQGQPTEIEVSLFKDGQPVAALEYWLGMRGHMIVRSQSGMIFGHIHAVGTMNDAFQPVTVAGNTVSFVYAFPTAEVYHVWIQVMVDKQIMALPVQIQVAAK